MRRLALTAAFSLLATAALAAQSGPPGGVGVDQAGIDKTVRPGDGFDAYANGGWRKATPIPADRASIGVLALNSSTSSSSSVIVVPREADAEAEACASSLLRASAAARPAGRW